VEKVKNFLEWVSSVWEIVEPIVEYLKDRFGKLGEKLKQLSEMPGVRKLLRGAKKVLGIAIKALTLLASIFEGIGEGSGEPIAKGIGEILGALAFEILVAGVTALVLALLEGAPALLEAAAGVVIAGLGIWIGDKFAKLAGEAFLHLYQDTKTVVRKIGRFI